MTTTMTKKRPRPAAWTHVAYVESESRPGLRHELKRRRVDGHLGCSCEAYRWARGEKTCHHTRAYDAPTTVYARGPERGVEVARVTVHTPAKTETFTIRRAISFGPLA